jgi:uncharacterized circularly permuted ATP-grasp superfamily protein
MTDPAHGDIKTMDTKDTSKTALDAQTAAMEEKLAVLRTQDGAEAFIAGEMAKIDAVLPTLQEPKLKSSQISMKTFLTSLKSRMTQAPDKAVAAEIQRTETLLLETAVQIADIQEKETP